MSDGVDSHDAALRKLKSAASRYACAVEMREDVKSAAACRFVDSLITEYREGLSKAAIDYFKEVTS